MPQVIYCARKGNLKRKGFEVVLTSFIKERLLKVKKIVCRVTLLKKRKIIYSEDNKRRKTKTRL